LEFFAEIVMRYQLVFGVFEAPMRGTNTLLLWRLFRRDYEAPDSEGKAGRISIALVLRWRAYGECPSIEHLSKVLKTKPSDINRRFTDFK
jgi:hypothetical protein